VSFIPLLKLLGTLMSPLLLSRIFTVAMILVGLNFEMAVVSNYRFGIITPCAVVLFDNCGT
jgi:hypothetical protein